MGPKADQLRALREAKLTGNTPPRLGTEKLRKIVQAKTSTKTKPKASAPGQPKENPMISITTNSHAPSRPQTLASPGQTPREQVDAVLAATAAGQTPAVPPFLDQTAGKTPAEIRAITAANAKKDAKARAKGPKLSSGGKSAAMLPRNLEPAGKAILKEKTKMKAKTERAKKAVKKAAKKAAAKAAGKAPMKAKSAPAPKKAPAPKPADGSRNRYDWGGAEEKAKGGVIQGAPDFSAETHKAFRGKLEEVVALGRAGDIKGLKALKINPTSSSPKAIERYRKIIITALEYRKG